MDRESLEFDIVIIGAGPAGLSAAIRLAQLNQKQNKSLSICVLEKGAAVGSHILSGAVFEPRALNELIPDWQEKGAPLKTQAIQDSFVYLTQSKAFKLPTPAQMRNQGNYIISLGEFCRWLARQAEQLGVEIFPGFPASELIIRDNIVRGVMTKDMGLDKDGKPSDRFQAGIEIHAKHTLLAEGARGSLSKQAIKHFKLDQHSQAQTYGIGIKELWEFADGHSKNGQVLHTVGWPLDAKTYGGSFAYHYADNKLAVGFVVGLDYQNPYLDPFCELQRFKTHPSIAPFFNGAKRIGYGARALVEGGQQCLPKLNFPGGLLIGDAAGFLNVPKIKGNHMAMKSGMLAAESIFAETDFAQSIKDSWCGKELYQVRNIRPGFKRGLWTGITLAALDTYIFRGNAPWTFKHHTPDNKSLKPAAKCQSINYPKPDDKLTFNKLSSVYLSNTNHNENQPCHLQLTDPKLAIDVNLKTYAAPETRYCPANVYEIVEIDGSPQLQINFANCVHCKTCDIKDPKQNINWITPEGGDGPNYQDL